LATPVLSLTELANTSSERTTLNNSVNVLDALFGIVDSADINTLTLPASPSTGQLVLLSSPATGAASGFSGHLAVYLGTGWKFVSPTKLGAVSTELGSYQPNGLGTGWVSVGGAAGATNLAVANRTASTLDITSDTGTDASVPAASTTEAGLLSAADKTKLDASVATNTVNTFTRAQGTAPVALVDGATISTDASLSNTFTVTLAGNRTLANPTNLVAGFVYNWHVTQDATGSRTLAYDTLFDWGAAGVPTLSTAAGATDWISAQYLGGELRAVIAKGFT